MVQTERNDAKVLRRDGKSSLPLLMPLLVFGFSLIYLGLSYNYGLKVGDEGYLMAGVTRILDGQLPYIDYVQNYSPGRFYFFAALFKLFGSDLLLIRKFWVILYSLSALLIFLLARRMVPLWAAFIPPLLLILSPSPFHKSFFLFIPLLNLYLTALYLEKKIEPFWFGFAAGLTILFRQDVGVAGVAVGLAAIAIEKRWGREHQTYLFGKLQHLLRKGGRLCLGVICALLPLFFYYWMHSGIGELTSQLLLSGLKTNKGMPIPFPELKYLILRLFEIKSIYLLLIYYFPFLIYLLSLGLVIKSFAAKKKTTDSLTLHALVLLTGLLILPQALIRSDPPHMLQVLPPFYILLAYWIHRFSEPAFKKSALFSVRFPGAILFLIFTASAIYLCYVHLFLFYSSDSRSPFLTIFSKQYKYKTLNNSYARVRLQYYDSKVLGSVVKFILENSKKDDYLLCMPYESIFNFLTNRRNPTRYDLFLPGPVDGSREQQEEIIRSMENPKLKYIIIDDRPPDGMETRRMKYYITDVHQYISRHFELDKRIGPYLILKRTNDV